MTAASTEPKRPAPSITVSAWIDAHTTRGFIVEALDLVQRADTPEAVREWVRAVQQWRLDHEAWRLTQPIDVDLMSDRWRMLGGPWISGPHYLHADVDGERHTVNPREAATNAACVLGPEAFRAWATQFYELHEAEQRARAALVQHVVAGLVAR